MLFSIFLYGGRLIATLLSRCIDKRRCTSSRVQHHCARLDHLPAEIPDDETRTVCVYLVHYDLPPTFTEAEKNNLRFLRHWIASGRISEDL